MGRPRVRPERVLRECEHRARLEEDREDTVAVVDHGHRMLNPQPPVQDFATLDHLTCQEGGRGRLARCSPADGNAGGGREPLLNLRHHTDGQHASRAGAVEHHRSRGAHPLLEHRSALDDLPALGSVPVGVRRYVEPVNLGVLVDRK
jgi:hypothetical protein